MESRRSSKARLFVALDLPDDARAALVEWREAALGRRRELRLLDPAALHVTLVFLGYRDASEIPRVVSLIEPPAIEPPVLAATGIKPIPPLAPRLFALDLADEDGRCGAIQAAVADALQSAGLYEPEKRPFWPHVTLARVRKGERVRGVAVPPPPPEPWRGAAVTLYRSHLSPRGASYEPLERIPLTRST